MNAAGLYPDGGTGWNSVVLLPVVAQGTAAELSARAGTPTLEDAFVQLIGSGEGLAA